MDHTKKVVDFGIKLITTLDLDPIYVILYNAYKAKEFDLPTLKKWILCYLYCYHAGIASYITNAKTNKEYWNLLRRADNEWHDRLFGAERRKGTRFLDGINRMSEEF